MLPSEKFKLPSLERAQEYQGRFPLPPDSHNQNPSRVTTPPPPPKFLEPPLAPSSPRASRRPLSKSPSFRQSLTQSKDSPAVSEMPPPPPRPKHKAPRPGPLRPPIQLKPGIPGTPSRLRFEYILSPEGKLSPRHTEHRRPLPDSGTGFKICHDSNSEDPKDSDETGEEEKNAEQESFSESESQESSISTNDDDESPAGKHESGGKMTLSEMRRKMSIA